MSGSRDIQQQEPHQRLDRIEEMMERLEQRLWLTVYGVVAVILAPGVQSILEAVP